MKRDVLIRLKQYLGIYKKRYAIVCFSGIAIAFLEMLPPRLVGHAVDGMAIRHQPWTSTWTVAAIWVAIVLLIQGLQAAQIYLANACGERIVSKIRREIFAHLQRLPVSYFEKTHIGRILSVHGNDLDSMKATLSWGLNTIVANGTVMLLASLMICLTDWKLFLAVAWLGPVTVFLSFLYSNKIGKAWQAVRRQSSRVSAKQAETIAGMRVVAAFNRQEMNQAEFSRLQEEDIRRSVRACALSGVFQPLLQWIRFIGQGIILIYGGIRVAHGTISPGSVIAASMYWEVFMQPTISFGVFFNDLLVSMTAAERVFGFLDEPHMQDAEKTEEISSVRGHVRLENVTFGYEEDRPVVQDVHLDIAPGKTVAVVGSSGSGKTTLMSLLARFYEPQQGRVLIDGRDVRSVTQESLRDQIAAVPQRGFLFGGTVMENLKYSNVDATDEMVIEATQMLGCHERFLALRDGYETQVGERGSGLSAGERQLICFTRALLGGAKVLLLDEATSAVDPGTELQVRYALKKLASRRTTFMVAHRLSTVRHADTILVMESGKIVEKGTHDELVAQGGTYSHLQRAHGAAELEEELAAS